MLVRSSATLALLLGAVLPFAACLETGGSEVYACPDKGVFTGQDADGGPPVASVSTLLERRCGTLDCHGSLYRPMRIYGRYGLRAPSEGNVTGGKATTTFEHGANYGAVCSIEPDKMAEVTADFGQSADQLLFLRKARGVEGHKGGAAVTPGSDADECILGWLRGDDLATVSSRCQLAIDALE
jgi:hypothetical protein